MTKKNMIAHIEERFNEMDWFITYHQDKADAGLREAKLLLDNTEGMSYQDYQDCKGMMHHHMHENIVRQYKSQKDMLNEILTEITGNFYGGKELLTYSSKAPYAEDK